MRALLIGALALATLTLAPAPVEARLQDNGVQWTQMNFGTKKAVIGVFDVPGMDWTKTRHSFVLTDGTTRGNKFYVKNLGKQFYEEFRADGSVKVRYNVFNWPGTRDIAVIKVTLRDAAGNSLQTADYVVQ